MFFWASVPCVFWYYFVGCMFFYRRITTSFPSHGFCLNFLLGFFAQKLNKYFFGWFLFSGNSPGNRQYLFRHKETVFLDAFFNCLFPGGPQSHQKIADRFHCGCVGT